MAGWQTPCLLMRLTPILRSCRLAQHLVWGFSRLTSVLAWGLAARTREWLSPCVYCRWATLARPIIRRTRLAGSSQNPFRHLNMLCV